MADFAPDTFIRAQQFTRTTHRDVYPFIDPSLPPLANSQSGRTIVITGASAGLGHLAYARSFAAASAKTLVLGARSVGKLEQVKKGLVVKFPKLEVVIGALDVADPKSQEAFWKMVKEKEGSADVLISNAGTDPGPFTVTDVDESVWWSNMETNIRGHFLSCQHFLRLLPSPKKSSTSTSASNSSTDYHPTIVHTSSGFVGVPAGPDGLSTNAVAKLAATQLCSYIAAEHPEVTVVAMHPGIVLTNIIETAFSAFKGIALDTYELVGGTAVFLATPAAHFLSGRLVWANWSMDELVARKEEIVSKDLLKIVLSGEFGAGQFA